MYPLLWVYFDFPSLLLHNIQDFWSIFYLIHFQVHMTKFEVHFFEVSLNF